MLFRIEYSEFAKVVWILQHSIFEMQLKTQTIDHQRIRLIGITNLIDKLKTLANRCNNIVLHSFYVLAHFRSSLLDGRSNKNLSRNLIVGEQGRWVNSLNNVLMNLSQQKLTCCHYCIRAYHVEGLLKV